MSRGLTNKALALLDHEIGNNEQQAARREILGIPIDFIDYKAVFQMIQQWRASDERQFIIVETAADIQLSRDENLRKATLRAGLNLPDGISVVFAAGLLGYKTRGRVTGPELMLRVADWGCRYGYRHYFYGSTEDVVQKLEQRLKQRYPGIAIVGSTSPPFRPLTQKEDQEIIERINASRPDVLWVGLGGPKQIHWMANHVGSIEATAMIGVGAAFNFHSGTVKWAPYWMRQIGMEWIYRTINEPRKLIPRTRHTLAFGWRVVMQSMTWRLTGKLRSRSKPRLKIR